MILWSHPCSHAGPCGANVLCMHTRMHKQVFHLHYLCAFVSDSLLQRSSVIPAIYSQAVSPGLARICWSRTSFTSVLHVPLHAQLSDYPFGHLFPAAQEP